MPNVRDFEQRLGLDQGAVTPMDEKSGPKKRLVYLAHASEDKAALGRPLAEKLLAKGIDVWLDEWEIRSGDSLRQRMDQGLGECTHFLVLLTPKSIGKPWVQVEIDVGFMKAVEGRGKFIGIRVGVGLDQLSELVRSRRCPEIDLGDGHQSVDELISDILEISRKPPVGSMPDYIEPIPPGVSHWRPATVLVAKQLVLGSVHGGAFDPQVTIRSVADTTGLPEQDVRFGVLELEEYGLIQRSREIGSDRFFPTRRLFVEFDRHFMNFDNERDAIAVAVRLVSENAVKITATELAAKFPDWPPRRLNSALNYLIDGIFIESSKALDGQPYVATRLYVTDRTRRLVHDHG